MATFSVEATRIDPKWAHGKKAIVEPDRLQTAQEIQASVCEHYQCEQREPLQQKVEAKDPPKIRKKVA